MNQQPKKRKTLRRWIVPMRYTLTGECIVEARSAEKAKDKANALNIVGSADYTCGELVDWEAYGTPEVDE